MDEREAGWRVAGVIAMATPQVLALRLEAPLQSWGDNARWSIRGTRPEPTLSGVLGLLAASSGWRLDDDGDRRVAELARRVRFGVRADREGVSLRDYHTIGGSHSGRETPWTGLLTAEGKIKRTTANTPPHTEVSERGYLCDACFLVMLEADEATLEELEAAVRRPVWPPFFGRKACVPAAPIYPALPGVSSRVAGSLIDAIAAFPWLGRESDKPRERLRVVVDEAAGATEGLRSLRHDVPQSFRHRRFSHRYVREFTVATVRPRTEA
ncbi:MAG: type I-E CRISPR-associated protein Cas5/CasD [Propionibacterium sp.]|nr:type I-E CRISPR-associated protein Cas5/CasD [Propionibacterium sp.]